MVEQSLFKTKMCVLYQRGHCSRRNCSFAHGDAELRRFLGSYSGRRDSRDGDLRDRLDRRLSPEKRSSQGGDLGGQHPIRGYSPVRSVEKRSDRILGQKYVRGQRDFSVNLKNLDEVEDGYKGRRKLSSCSHYAFEEQLKEVKLDISRLDDHRLQLGIFLEEKVQEADCLRSRVQELEAQLKNEKDESRKITFKIKRICKAHKTWLNMQDELKKSQARLQKLEEQLGLAIRGTGGIEEDLNINDVSDSVPTDFQSVNPPKGFQNNSLTNKKRLHTDEEVAQDSIPKGGHRLETMRSKKRSRRNINPASLNVERENGSSSEENNDHRPLGDDERLRGRRKVPSTMHAANEVKGTSSEFTLPSTSMAADAVDEVVEDGEKNEVLCMGSKGSEVEAMNAAGGGLPVLLPLPPIPQSSHQKQYEGEDENVDIDGL